METLGPDESTNHSPHFSDQEGMLNIKAQVHAPARPGLKGYTGTSSGSTLNLKTLCLSFFLPGLDFVQSHEINSSISFYFLCSLLEVHTKDGCSNQVHL